MSTYNGEKYIRMQLDSILGQTYENLCLLIRDDGSTDQTVSILEEYAKRDDRITYYTGKNIGVIQSFLELVKNSSEEAGYYAFADQDDVWLPEKIGRAVEKIEAVQEPALYCSETYLTDEELNVLHKDEKMARPSFGNALVQNICTGCTAVINKSLRDLIKETSPQNIVMHDWWLYLSAAAFGTVYYDKEAYIKYRQHGNNRFGAKTSKWQVWRYRLGQLGKKRGELFAQLEEFEDSYPQLDEKKKEMTELVRKAQKGFVNRVKLVCNREIYRNKRMDDAVYRGIVLVGKL